MGKEQGIIYQAGLYFTEPYHMPGEMIRGSGGFSSPAHDHPSEITVYLHEQTRIPGKIEMY